MTLLDLKILSIHPTQYHALFLRKLVNEGIDIEVGYYHQGSAGRKGFDEDFGIDIAWDIDLLDGYSYRFFCEGVANYGLAEQVRLAPKLIYWALQNPHTPLLLMGWFPESMWLIWILRIFRHAPILVMSETTPASFTAIKKANWRIAILRWLLRHSSANLYIGVRNRVFLREIGVAEDKLFYAPYSIDNSRFTVKSTRLLADRRTLCEQYKVDSELPTFLFCGKLIPKKRPLQLLEAYLSANLADNVQLLFVGEGKLRKELEQRILESGLKHVHLLGFLNQSQMPQAYVLGEVLCLISDPTETWGLVVNEALACGLPVIVADSVGCSPNLVDSENGWITPLDDNNELARTLVLAINQYADWKIMGEISRDKVSKHTFSAMAEGVISAIKYIRHE